VAGHGPLDRVDVGGEQVVARLDRRISASEARDVPTTRTAPIRTDSPFVT
jgi:hypothetical protein